MTSSLMVRLQLLFLITNNKVTCEQQSSGGVAELQHDGVVQQRAVLGGGHGQHLVLYY